MSQDESTTRGVDDNRGNYCQLAVSIDLSRAKWDRISHQALIDLLVFRFALSSSYQHTLS